MVCITIFQIDFSNKLSLVTTLRAPANFIEELIDDGCEFVRTARFQSDTIEKRFSRYGQMSGERFLVSLREVFNSERILSCRLLIRENINFSEENIDSDAEESLDSINDLFDEKADEIMEGVLEVATRLFCQKTHQTKLPRLMQASLGITS